MQGAAGARLTHLSVRDRVAYHIMKLIGFVCKSNSFLRLTMKPEFICFTQQAKGLQDCRTTAVKQSPQSPANIENNNYHNHTHPTGRPGGRAGGAHTRGAANAAWGDVRAACGCGRRLQ